MFTKPEIAGAIAFACVVTAYVLSLPEVRELIGVAIVFEIFTHAPVH